MSTKAVVAVIAVLGVAALVVVGAVFKPWLLFVDVRVDDALPTTTPVPTATQPKATSTPEPAGPVELAGGTFISHEHETTGSVRIVQNPDGTRVLAIEGLDTSNGPDVHVWLSASDVVEGVDGWYTAGSAPFLDLGLIKGNQGDQLYEIPADVDLTQYRSVALWCVQFSVSFGAAQLS